MTNDQLLHHLRRFADDHPTLTLADFCRALGISHNVIYRRFGSWRNMREAAGLPRHRPHCPAYSEADILADLLQVYRRAGRCPGHSDHIRWGGRISPTTIAKRYGCWRGVRIRFELYLREIGLSREPVRRS